MRAPTKAAAARPPPLPGGGGLPNPSGPDINAYLLELNSTLLSWSLGVIPAVLNDAGYGVAFDPFFGPAVFVVGATASFDYPVAAPYPGGGVFAGPFGASDGFITRIN